MNARSREVVDVCFYSGRTAVWWKRAIFALYRFVTGAQYIHINLRRADGTVLQCNCPGRCEIVEPERWQHEPEIVIPVCAFRGIDETDFVLRRKSSLFAHNCRDATRHALRLTKKEFDIVLSQTSQRR